ncbi:GNAT family N-acetyltransferase [Ralstonia solanacearum]|uniref:GNAT family N-acetyltransferase n=1 Tax=Ralstonia solanacearum TaxID=305 RepID=UPI001866B3AE|nr:GNAT family N-acetyltransferase [Ralstonia solanacearum]QOK83495.1 GNAT family N-acetyltransferase [Ralstonia solanacearum]
MTTRATIRRAGKGDAAALCAAEKATALTPGLLVSQPHELQVDAFEQKIEFLEQEGMYLVAEREGVLIGHALLEPMVLIAQAHVFSLTIVVHPGYLEHGIGTALMVELMGWAENNPRVEKIELRVRATNARALALYKRFGFVEEGRFERRIRLPDGSYIDDVLMARFTR